MSRQQQHHQSLLHQRSQRLKHQSGYALVMVVFIVVVMSSAMTTMLHRSNASLSYQNFQLRGQRALMAAQSGIEWATYQISNTSACPVSPTTINLTTGALSGFDVTVECTTNSHTEGGVTINLFDITSIAIQGDYENGAEPVSRTLTVSLVL